MLKIEMLTFVSPWCPPPLVAFTFADPGAVYRITELDWQGRVRPAATYALYVNADLDFVMSK